MNGARIFGNSGFFSFFGSLETFCAFWLRCFFENRCLSRLKREGIGAKISLCSVVSLFYFSPQFYASVPVKISRSLRWKVMLPNHKIRRLRRIYRPNLSLKEQSPPFRVFWNLRRLNTKSVAFQPSSKPRTCQRTVG